MNLFKASIIAGAGGFLGTCLRFGSEKLGALMLSPATFPLGTFIANMCGCFLIGIFYGLATKTMNFGKSLNLLLITGFCGGFTTFSSFSDELMLMLGRGSSAMFFFYMLASIAFGLIMVVLGIACIRPAGVEPQTKKA